MLEAGRGELKAMWEQAVQQVLGSEALELDELAKKQRQEEAQSMGLGDFFFDPGDELNPDAE
jgi:hypothetical protein